MYSNKLNQHCELELRIDSFYNVSGHTFRQHNGNKQLRLISGTFNPKDLSIYIREYALSSQDCPIFIQGKVSRIINNIFSIAGVFQSFDTSLCEKGHINMICRDFVFRLFKTPKKEPTIKPEELEKALTTLLMSKVKEEKNFIQITKKDTVKFASSLDTIFLKIYDHQKVDGDRVRIEFNKTVVANNYPLFKEEKLFKLIPKKGLNLLKITATNEGRILKNTSRVELYNNSFQKYFVNVLHKNEFITYEIVVEN